MEDEIEKTITSVLSQTCTDFEYLIKDGVSQDKTVSIAKAFAPAFAKKGIRYQVISQPDMGIYDAMNQAIGEAQGEWLVFMNAGDSFASKTILEQVDKSGCLELGDIVYGDKINCSGKWFRYQKAFPLDYIRHRLPFCHQSSFTKRELFHDNLYSVQYRICSDYKFYLQMYRNGKRFVYFPEAVAIFDLNGISNSKGELVYKEMIQILEEMPPFRDEEAIQKLKEMQKEMLRNETKKHREMFMHQHLWKYIPQTLREKRREMMNKKAGWKTEEEFFGTKKDNP